MRRDPVHSDLRINTWMNQWLGMPFMILMAGGILFSAVRGYLVKEEPWQIGIIRISISLLFLWAGYYLWQSGRRSRRMTWVLEHIAGLPVRMAAGTLESGAVTVQMWTEGADGRNSWSMLFDPPAWDSRLLDGALAEAHIDPRSGGPIVLNTAQGLLWPLEGSRSKRFGADPGHTTRKDPAPAGDAPQNPLDEYLWVLMERLRGDGLTDEVKWLESLAHETAWTSSSEMIGELGLAAKRIQRSARGRMTPDTRRALKRFLKEARKTWRFL